MAIRRRIIATCPAWFTCSISPSLLSTLRPRLFGLLLPLELGVVGRLGVPRHEALFGLVLGAATPGDLPLKPCGLTSPKRHRRGPSG